MTTTSDSDHGAHDGVIRLLDERTPGDQRICIKCMEPVSRETYFNTNFVCRACDADWETYPWRTTHGGLTP